MTNTTNNTLHSKHLRILQYNVSRSREIIDSILNDREVENYTILLLQEPYWSPHQSSSPLHQSWTLIDPPITDRTPRTAIYVNNAALPSSTFKQLPIPHRDITAISISHTLHQHLQPAKRKHNLPTPPIPPKLCQTRRLWCCHHFRWLQPASSTVESTQLHQPRSPHGWVGGTHDGYEYDATSPSRHNYLPYQQWRWRDLDWFGRG